ncbi:MAG: MurR/RpiR family transcriptional regulator [Micromonosporaceae bacterium]|nr:MurR/RpiR family transcriptional regulator [Micromonosporaceae bacterium]
MAKIGQLLVDNPTLPLDLSITELAERAGTSAATVTRFCRLIGYSGYLPLRVAAAADHGRSSAQPTWEHFIGRTFDPTQPPADVLRALLTVHVDALRSTADLIDLVLLQRVAAAIATSRHTDIYGIGGSGLVAMAIQERLYRIGINAHAWTEVHLGLTSSALLDEETVAIAISNTGRTNETIEMLALAASRGAFTVALSSDPGSPLAEVADVHVSNYAPGEYLQPEDFAAQHAQLFVFDLLYLLVAQHNYDRTTTNLALTAAAVANHRGAHHRSARSARKSAGSTTNGHRF